jgi:fucose permease
MVGRFGAGLLTGTMGSTVFYALLAAGRFLNGSLATRTRATRLLLWGAAASAVALLCLALAPTAVVAMLGFGAAGFCLAGIYPNLVAFATERRPDRPGAMAGLISSGGAIGVSVVPFAAGALGRGLGLGAMPWLLMGLGCLLVALAALAARPDPGHAVQSTPPGGRAAASGGRE